MKTPTIVHHMAATDGWQYPPNSLEAIEACLDTGAAVIELDITALANDDYLLVHDPVLERETDGHGEVGACSSADARKLHIKIKEHVLSYHVPQLSEVVALLQRHSHKANLQLDFKNAVPFASDEPLTRLAQLVAPLGKRVIVSSGADWQLRRLHTLAPDLRLGFDIMWYLDWSADPANRHAQEPPFKIGAYGYLDDSLYAQRKIWNAARYLEDRCESLMGLLPYAEIWYVRHTFIARCLDDEFDLSAFLHARNVKLDAWTLDIGNPVAETNARRLRDIGTDLITTNTPRKMRERLSN